MKKDRVRERKVWPSGKQYLEKFAALVRSNGGRTWRLAFFVVSDFIVRISHVFVPSSSLLHFWM